MRYDVPCKKSVITRALSIGQSVDNGVASQFALNQENYQGADILKCWRAECGRPHQITPLPPHSHFSPAADLWLSYAALAMTTPCPYLIGDLGLRAIDVLYFFVAE